MTVPLGTTVPLQNAIREKNLKKPTSFSVHRSAGPTRDRTEDQTLPKARTEDQINEDRSGLVSDRKLNTPNCVILIGFL